MFNQILLAVDGSPFAADAIPYAVDIAREFHSEVFVLHVHEREPGRAGAFPLETVVEAERIVAQTVKTFKAAGIPVAGEVQHAIAGHTPKHIVDTATSKGADLIVMGSRGLSDIGGLMLGSVTHKVLQLADVPVFVARGSKVEAEKELVTPGALPASR